MIRNTIIALCFIQFFQTKSVRRAYSIRQLVEASKIPNCNYFVLVAMVSDYRSCELCLQFVSFSFSKQSQFKERIQFDNWSKHPKYRTVIILSSLLWFPTTAHVSSAYSLFHSVFPNKVSSRSVFNSTIDRSIENTEL